MDFTDEELALIDSFPDLPPIGAFHSSNIWVIEWLNDKDTKTGKDLYEWLKVKRPGWSAYRSCRTKADVFAAIEEARQHALRHGSSPVLHFEMHGSEHRAGTDVESMGWDELTGPLRSVNEATGCNLTVVMAACTGFAALRALSTGPIIPAMALVGPDRELCAADVLNATKELYRRWMENTTRLHDMAESASRETSGARLEVEAVPVLAREALIEALVSKRRFAQESVARGDVEAARRAWQDSRKWQFAWDQMFMIDRYPKNASRLGLDMHTLIARFNDSLPVECRP